jgi:hypothetical protein
VGVVPLSFSTVEAALIAWLTPTFGSGKVILKGEKGTQPNLPYAVVSIAGPRRAGAPRGSVVQDFDPAQVGAEVGLTVVVEEELGVSVQAYTAPRSNNSSAKALLAVARTRILLPSVHDALATAGLALIEVSDTQDLTALLETGFQGRAVLDLRFLVTDEAAERTGYVATVGITGVTT